MLPFVVYVASPHVERPHIKMTKKNREKHEFI